MTIAAFCPSGLILFITAVILVAMGFSLLRVNC